MRISFPYGACLFLVTVFLGGCRLLNDEAVVQGHSPLQPAPPSPDSVTPEINHDAWREIDETRLSPSIQRELANNGLRAGVIGTRVPEAFNHVLHRGNSPAEQAETAAAEETVEVTAEPIVHGRVQRLRRNQRSEIQASEIYASLPLLVSAGRELSGQTYQQAQAIYALRVDPQPDRTVDVELTPEIHHGAARIRWTGGDDGILRQAPLRDREVFDQLRLRVRLAPGEMLVLTSLPDAGSRLGHYFHTVDSADGPQQKLILIRLAEVPPSDTFAATAR
jgi:hypothetical protein